MQRRRRVATLSVLVVLMVLSGTLAAVAGSLFSKRLTVAVRPTATPSSSVAGRPSVQRWTPAQQDRWLYQLGSAAPRLNACVKPWSGGGRRCVKPTVWALDLYAPDGATVNRAAVNAIHRVGGRAVCYVSAGSVEDWRPDAKQFPRSVVGNALDGWPGEKWLDVRALRSLRPLMETRADRCVDAGFDAIDWDNVDGYTNESGFPLRAEDQLTYNRVLAAIAHERDLSVGLKNDLGQIPQLVRTFDFAINEQCVQFNECQLLLPFSEAGKPVVQIEYAAAPSSFCPFANRHHWAAVVMSRDLRSAPWTPCR